MLGRRVMELVGCGFAGAGVWAVFVVGRTGDEAVPLGFWAGMVGLVVLLAFVVDGHRAAWAAFGGAAVLALWTAPRGDNDGLWMVIEFLLAAAAGVGGLLTGAIRRMIPRAPWAPPTGVVAGVVLLGAMGTGVLVADRRADPYPALERRLAGFPAPASFEADGVHRRGDPLCNWVCGAFVEGRFTTAASPEEACADLGAALSRWPGVDAEAGEPIFDDDCQWDFADGSAVVDGGVITVTVGGKRGGGAGVGA